MLALPLPQLGLDASVLAIVMQVVLLILCLGTHEAAHAWSAWKCGDSTAKDEGRLTLNPIVHIDLWMTILLPGLLLFMTQGRFVFGGAKPVPVNFHRLRHPWRDMSLVALAGPFSNLLLAVLFLLLYKVLVLTGWYNGAADFIEERKYDLLPIVMKAMVKTNLLLTLFNLVPIPPLDGSRVMAWLLPNDLRSPYLAIERFGMILVFILLYGGSGFSSWLYSSIDTLYIWLRNLVSLGGRW
ncbi:MAG: site-2 protease family protein [Planctomycetes bacterium]|nr:site-2 protease family protein [Planctomycetota bacterium]